MIATAPGKLILTGEYAVLDGATALVIAVNRRAIATAGKPAEQSAFLVAVAEEMATRFGADSPPALAARETVVDSAAFYRGAHKLGLGSSAAVTVAATALALGTTIDRETIREIAAAAHAGAQGARGARGSGADIAAAIYGGAIAFTGGAGASVARLRWPAVTLLACGCGASADTASLVAQVVAARAAHPAEVGAALTAIAEASRSAADATDGAALIAALARAAEATDQLARATGVALVPDSITRARAAISALGGALKTTGAGGGDVAVAVLPITADATIATQTLIEAGCTPLELTVDDAGVDLRSAAQ